MFLWILEEWASDQKTYKEDHILDMIAYVFSFMLNCYKTGRLSMYFMPEINLFQQYPAAVHGNYNLVKKQDSVETIDQILRQLADKKSLIYIVNNCFQENFKEVSSQVFWTDMSPLPETEGIIFHLHRNDNDYPKCEEDMLHFQLKLYIELLENLYKSVFHNRNNVDCGIICSLYHLWVFQSKYFFEKEMQFHFLTTYYRSIRDFLKKTETLCHSKDLPTNETELTCEPYFVFLRKNFYYNKSDFMKHLNLGAEELELQGMLINGSLDGFLYSMFPSIGSVKYKEYLRDSSTCYNEQSGDKARSEEVQKIMETMFFYENDQIFHNFVDMLNVHFINEVMTKKGRKFKLLNSTKELYHTNYSETAFFLRNTLISQLCEMYNYGFTAKKFALPTPATYISFISQFAVNLDSTMKRDTDGRVIDKWGYTVKDGKSYNYRTYEDRLYNTFLLNLEESKERKFLESPDFNYDYAR